MIRTHPVISTSIPATMPTLAVVQSDWRTQLPVLSAKGVTLRELRLSDAHSLHQLLTTAEVRRFISPPPTTVEGFQRFIEWTHGERSVGTYVCFAVVPHGMDTAVGIFQVRQLGHTFETAEWGFALGQAYWGTGLFVACAGAVVDFAVETLKVQRLEARSAVANGRGNGALQKIGAAREAVLRRSFLKDGEYLDQVLWSITADDWKFFRTPTAPVVH